MMTLVTGANGFVGEALCERLRRDAVSVRGAVRSLNPHRHNAEEIEVGDISSETDWSTALNNVQQVVHLAARVHIMNEPSSDPLADFRLANVDGTVRLAQQAAAANVKRFIFLSSIKVNGEFTEAGHPFSADAPPAPQDPYGISKHEAEQALRRIAAETGMDVVIIRPPLVYGPGVKANFKSMMLWLTCGIPLPLAAITDNRRSLVALDNLIDLIVTCLTHPAASNQTFLVSDDEDLSTADLFRRMGRALGKPARLFYVPRSAIGLGAKLLRRTGIYQRLCGSLQLDIGKTKRLLGWKPPVSVDDGLRLAGESLRQ